MISQHHHVLGGFLRYIQFVSKIKKEKNWEENVNSHMKNKIFFLQKIFFSFLFRLDLLNWANFLFLANYLDAKRRYSLEVHHLRKIVEFIILFPQSEKVNKESVHKGKWIIMGYQSVSNELVQWVYLNIKWKVILMKCKCKLVMWNRPERHTKLFAIKKIMLTSCCSQDWLTFVICSSLSFLTSVTWLPKKCFDRK